MLKNYSVSTVMVFFLMFTFASGIDNPEFEKDIIDTGQGKLEITFIGHGTLMLEFQGKVIHVDPWSRLADYSTLPAPALILITHSHGDHLDLEAIHHARRENTELVYTELCSQKVSEGTILRNGESTRMEGILVEAVPAYNIEHTRPDGNPYHPRGEGNGYVLTFGEGAARVYIAGDTENIPEMASLEDIDIAFLPMNLPYTMTPEMAADAAKSFRPSVLYPYHFGETDTGKLVDLLKDESDIEVRVRSME